MSSNQEALGDRVRAERKRRRMTQQELANAVGVSLGVVSNFERGLNLPQPSHLRAILAHLEMDIEAGDEVAAETRRTWPSDIGIFLDVIGLYLAAQPEERRQDIIYDLTRQIVNGNVDNRGGSVSG